jgi:signal transduction histidine kinase
MPITFVLIALSFTGVYAHQQTMRDFVVERDMALARLLAQIAEDGLAHGVVGGDSSGLNAWMALDKHMLRGEVMVIDGEGRVLTHVHPVQIGAGVQDVMGIAEALERREGFVIVQDAPGPVLVTFAPVNGANWTVVIREPVDDLIGPLLRFPSLIPAIAVGAGALSLLILFFGWWTIVRPLLQLAWSAEQVSWGDYSSIARSVQGVQEVRDLHRALTEMVERIRGYEAGVRDYLSAMTQGQEAERARLARELHDGPVQALIALGQRAEMAGRLLERGQVGEAIATLEELRHTEQETVRELRRTIGALRPIYLEDLGFVPALEMLAQQATGRSDAHIRLERGETVYRLAPEVELGAYRIVQEALNNALQHAQAQHVTLHVRCEEQILVLSVVDDGVGFDFPDQPSSLTQAGHFGLLGMRERALQLGGTLNIHTLPGGGTRVVARLPHPPVKE